MRYGDYAIGWLPYGKFCLHRKEKRINAKICIHGNYITLRNYCQAIKLYPTKVKKYNPYGFYLLPYLITSANLKLLPLIRVASCLIVYLYLILLYGFKAI